MDTETYTMLKRIAYHFWDDILDDDRKFNPGFHNLTTNDTVQPFFRPVPENHRREWFRVMNAMEAYGVLECKVEMDLDEDFNPYSHIFCYKISNFNYEKFIDFCFKLGIKLQETPKLHTVKLAIGDDNTPIVTVDGKKQYVYKTRNEAPFLRVLKIALAYSKHVLSVDAIINLCKRTDIQNRILGGQELDIDKDKRLVHDFVRKSQIEQNLLQYFFVILEKKIVAHSPLRVDDEELKEILEGSKPLK